MVKTVDSVGISGTRGRTASEQRNRDLDTGGVVPPSPVTP